MALAPEHILSQAPASRARAKFPRIGKVAGLFFQGLEIPDQQVQRAAGTKEKVLGRGFQKGLSEKHKCVGRIARRPTNASKLIRRHGADIGIGCRLCEKAERGMNRSVVVGQTQPTDGIEQTSGFVIGLLHKHALAFAAAGNPIAFRK